MKKFILSALLLASLLLGLANPSESANTATKLGTIPVLIGGNRYDAEMYLISYDTINTDLMIKPASAGMTNCTAGMFVSDSAAQNISFKLDGTNYITLKLAANQGVYDKLSSGIGICAVPGQDLQFKSSGTIGSMLIYVIQGNLFKFVR